MEGGGWQGEGDFGEKLELGRGDRITVDIDIRLDIEFMGCITKREETDYKQDGTENRAN